jgi:hypothetical protein
MSLGKSEPPTCRAFLSGGLRGSNENMFYMQGF